jgi:hypothetical protein
MIVRSMTWLLTALLLLLIPAMARAQTPSFPAPVSSDQFTQARTA